MTGTAACTGSRDGAPRDRTGRRSRRDRRGSLRSPKRQAAGLRHERRGDALPVGLADDPEAHRGRDQVRDEAESERLQGRLERDFVAGRRDRDRDRIGDRLGPHLLQEGHRRAGPAAQDRADEGIALRRRLEPALGGGRERQRERGDLGEPCAVAGAGGPVGRREQDRVVAGRAEGEKAAEPVLEARGVRQITGLVGPFEPVRIGEGADREGRRQPDHQRQGATRSSVVVLVAVLAVA